MPVYQRRFRWLLLALGGVTLAATLLFYSLIFLWPPGEGITRAHYGPEGLSSTARNWRFVYVDGADFGPQDAADRVNQVAFSGYLWQGAPGRTTWRIHHNGGVTLKINGETLLDVPITAPEGVDEVGVAWDGAALFLELEYTFQGADQPGRPMLAVYEPIAGGGWRLLPGGRLYPTAPDPAQAAQDQLHSRAGWLAGGVGGTGALLLCTLLLLAYRPWRSRDFWLALLLIAASLGLRLALLNDRAAHDPLFYWLTPGGDDNYPLMARQLYAGTFHLGTSYWQPGNILWMAFLTRLFGPGLYTLYLVNAVASSLTAALLFGAALPVFGRRAAFVGGLIAALYPPLAFYQVSLQTVPLDTLLFALALWVAVRALRRESLLLVALLGIISGALALFRATGLSVTLAFALLLLMRLLWRKSALRRVAAQLAVLTAMTLLPMLPQGFATLQHGEFSLTTINGSMNLYAGNNRDSDGTWPREIARMGMALPAAQQTRQFTARLLDDLRRDPLRFLELNLRKLGLMWTNAETPHNIDYQTQGLAVSPLLRALSLGGVFGMALLSIGGWAGAVYALLAAHRRADDRRWLLLWALLLALLSTAIIIVTGRLRILTALPLALFAGVYVEALSRVITGRTRRGALLLATGLSVGVAALAPLAASNLPRKHYLSALPADAAPRAYAYGGEIALAGMRPLDTDHERFVYVMLYWQALRPLDRDYHVSLQLVDAQGKRLAAVDAPLGTVAYPPAGTSHWPVGMLLEEGYLLEIPPDSPPFTQLVAVVYDGDEVLPVGDQPSGWLTDFAVAQPQTRQSAFAPRYVLDASLFLSSLQVSTGETALTIRGQLQSGEAYFRNATIFFHLLSSEGELVAQSDGQRISGRWTTSALIPGVAIAFERRLEYPPDLAPGTYQLVMGAYTLPSTKRLPIQDIEGRPLANNLIALGEISITQ